MQSFPIGTSALRTFVEGTGVLYVPVRRYKLHSALERFGLLYGKQGSGLVRSPINDYAREHTGATSFALLTEVRYAQATGDPSFAESRRAWLEALIGQRLRAVRRPGLVHRDPGSAADTIHLVG